VRHCVHATSRHRATTGTIFLLRATVAERARSPLELMITPAGAKHGEAMHMRCDVM